MHGHENNVIDEIVLVSSIFSRNQYLEDNKRSLDQCFVQPDVNIIHCLALFHRFAGLDYGLPLLSNSPFPFSSFC